MRKLTSLIFCIPLLVILVSNPDPSRAAQSSFTIPNPETAGRGLYAAPYELTPIKALPILKQAPAGALLSIGTERGFISAGLTPQVTSLICFDYDEGAVLYDSINAGLLKLSRDRNDYLQVRLSENYDQWRARMQNVPLKPEIKSILEQEKTFEWWKSNVRERADFEEFHHPAPRQVKEYPFKDANYLHDDVLFKRIHHLASNDKISAYLVDLRDASQTKALASEIARNHEKLAIVDISNVWQWFGGTQRIDDLGADASVMKLANALENLRPLLTDHSILLATTWGGQSGKFPRELSKAPRAARFPQNKYVTFSSTKFLGIEMSHLPDSWSLWKYLRSELQNNNTDVTYSYVQLNGRPIYANSKERGDAISKMVAQLKSEQPQEQRAGAKGLFALAKTESKPNDVVTALKSNLSQIRDNVIREDTREQLIVIESSIHSHCVSESLEKTLKASGSASF
jgi:hypothetical protein